MDRRVELRRENVDERLDFRPRSRRVLLFRRLRCDGEVGGSISPIGSSSITSDSGRGSGLGAVSIRRKKESPSRDWGTGSSVECGSSISPLVSLEKASADPLGVEGSPSAGCQCLARGRVDIVQPLYLSVNAGVPAGCSEMPSLDQTDTRCSRDQPVVLPAPTYCWKMLTGSRSIQAARTPRSPRVMMVIAMVLCLDVRRM